MNQILRDTPIWNNLNSMCMIEEKEIEVINLIYRRSRMKEDDDPMGQSGQGAGASSSATHGPEATGAGAMKG